MGRFSTRSSQSRDDGRIGVTFEVGVGAPFLGHFRTVKVGDSTRGDQSDDLKNESKLMRVGSPAGASMNLFSRTPNAAAVFHTGCDHRHD